MILLNVISAKKCENNFMDTLNDIAGYRSTIVKHACNLEGKQKKQGKK